MLKKIEGSDFDLGSTYTLADHGEQSILADKIKDIFLITFKLRLDKGVFGNL